jgi:cyclohexanone monooxygenase
MNAADAPPAVSPEWLDVLIVGAGLSGIGAARHLQARCPTQRFAILEARERLGGTWDLFRYPGIRSDSDMHTLGYAFKPWKAARAIADGPSILAYIHEAAAETGLAAQIRFGHRVVAAAWSSERAAWDVHVRRSDGGEPSCTLRARFLYLCSGYYSYAEGHRPDFEGEADFRGRVVHPQFWPPGAVHEGKRVVVVGSGATAITLVPALARSAAHVTMLQRSPTYVVSRPSRDAIAQTLRRLLPERLAYGLTRWKNILIGRFYYGLARKHPAATKRRIVEMVAAQLPPTFDVARHFAPRYDPWDQRVCVAPDGDLFRALQTGRASVVTESIARFTPDGVQLTNGQLLPADVVVLATGLKLNVLGDVALEVDGRRVDPAACLSYKGMMLGGVPNLVMTFGYTNASWTLRADLTAGYVCRLLRQLQRRGMTTATARVDPAVQPRPFLSFTSGYVQRALEHLPKQGDRAPWQVHQSYLADLLSLRWGRLDDGVLHFSRPTNNDTP